MKIPNATLQSGFSIPVFGYGTWGVCGRFQRDEQADDAAEVEAIRRALDAGITLIDTAELYADGHSERIIAEAISDRNRSELFLTSKVLPKHLHFDDVIASCKKSLERLKTDYLNLYLIHAPHKKIPLEETMKAMDSLVDEGLVRHIGVSNFTLQRLKFAQACSRHPVVVNQVHHNLIVRQAETKGLLAYCQTNDVLLQAFRPVEKGLLATCDNDEIASRIGVNRSTGTGKADYAAAGDHHTPLEPLVEADLTILKDMCEKYSASPAQIAIAWLLAQENIVTIAKMSSEEHLRDNLGALHITMESADVEMLREDFPLQLPVSPAVPLQ